MNTFKKEERLCSKKLLDLLFANGSSFLVYPYRVLYLETASNSPYPAQVVINVSKKRYKRAVDRNLIKRKVREAYRLHKSTHFYPSLRCEETMLLLAIQYIGKEVYDYRFLEKRLLQVFKKLQSNLATHEDH